jgi:hypothetical protein
MIPLTSLLSHYENCEPLRCTRKSPAWFLKQMFYTKSEPGAVATGLVRVLNRFFKKEFVMMGEVVCFGTTRSLRLPVLTLCDYGTKILRRRGLNTLVNL